MSVMPAPGFVMPAATASWLTVEQDHDGRGDRADDLGDDVADGIGRGGPLVEDHRRRSRPG